METINLGARDGLPPVDWAAVVEELDAKSAPAPDAANSRTTWLATVNEDGSPHVTAVGALWLDGTFWFQTGASTRKGRNVTRDPRCSLAVSVRDADVVLEGEAVRVTDPSGGGPRCAGVGGQRLAGGAGRERIRHHCPVQRTVAGPTAVERVSHRATLGDRGVCSGTGWSDPLPVLTASGRAAQAFWRAR